MLFKELSSSHETKTKNRVKRPERNRKEKETQAREELTQLDLLELMGANERGFKRRRGAWRQA